VSTSAGLDPHWGASDGELFYINLQTHRLNVVTVKRAGQQIDISGQRSLFEVRDVMNSAPYISITTSPLTANTFWCGYSGGCPHDTACRPPELAGEPPPPAAVTLACTFWNSHRGRPSVTYRIWVLTRRREQ
jgi:hypothetical protein